MKIITALAALASALLLGATPSLAATPGSTSHSGTPSSCIARNHGDVTACNVGNSGGGDLPYRYARAPRTPDECVKVNQGDSDWPATWGNSGRGDLPYMSPSR